MWMRKERMFGMLSVLVKSEWRVVLAEAASFCAMTAMIVKMKKRLLLKRKDEC